MSNYYTIQEAADELRVDYKVVYRMIRQGRLPATRIGWQFRIAREDLMAYLTSERVVQASVAQSIRGDQASTPRAGEEDAQAADTGKSSMGSEGVSKLQARQLELAYINRFREKVLEIVTLRHPLSGEILNLRNQPAIEEEESEQEALMDVLNTAFLSASVLATTPQNLTKRFRIRAKSDLVIEARYLAHLGPLVRKGYDSEPGSVEDVMLTIQQLLESSAEDVLQVTGLASPTGWSQEAIKYIAGSEQGTTWHSATSKIVLVDLRTGAVYWNTHDPVVSRFAPLYELPTENERVASLQLTLQAEIESRVDRGVILRDFAQEIGIEESLLHAAAVTLSKGSKYRLIDDPRHGTIIVATP